MTTPVGFTLQPEGAFLDLVEPLVRELADYVEIAPETFLRQMYETLPPRTIDAVAIHPYSFPTVPSDDADWNPFPRLARMHDIVARAEGRSVPLWLTEFGAAFVCDTLDGPTDSIVRSLRRTL